MKNRRSRLAARRYLIRLASEVYTEGDDAIDLENKMVARINNEAMSVTGVEEIDWKQFLLEVLKVILPLLIRLFVI